MWSISGEDTELRLWKQEAYALLIVQTLEFRAMDTIVRAKRGAASQKGQDFYNSKVSAANEKCEEIAQLAAGSKKATEADVGIGI